MLPSKKQNEFKKKKKKKKYYPIILTIFLCTEFMNKCLITPTSPKYWYFCLKVDILVKYYQFSSSETTNYSSLWINLIYI